MMKVDVFHIGPQKTATTWAYHCLKEHPEVSVPNKDAIHYFDINFPKGEEWLKSKYPPVSQGIYVETTPSYIRSVPALKRIKEYNDNAKIVLCIRSPLERMVSHYWHEKKKGSINYNIEDVLDNYDLFSSWVETSMYGDKVEELYQMFGRERVFVQVYDDLKKDPYAFLRDLYEFIGVDDASFTPASLEKKINKATKKKGGARLLLIKLLKEAGVLDRVINLKNKVAISSGKSSYDTKELLSSLPETLRSQIYDITRRDVEKLSKLIERDMLKEWGYDS